MDNSDSAGQEGPFDGVGGCLLPHWRMFLAHTIEVFGCMPDNKFRLEAAHDLHIAPNWAAAGNQARIGTPGYQTRPSPLIGPGYHSNSHPWTGSALPVYSEPSHLYNRPAAVVGGVGNYEQNMNPSGGMKTEEVPHDNRKKYKTELCYHWERRGYCRYGDHCIFAHGEQELRPVTRHAHYKTKLCYNVLAGGSCSFGHRCHFLHTLSDNI